MTFEVDLFDLLPIKNVIYNRDRNECERKRRRNRRQNSLITSVHRAFYGTRDHARTSSLGSLEKRVNCIIAGLGNHRGARCTRHGIFHCSRFRAVAISYAGLPRALSNYQYISVSSTTLSALMSKVKWLRHRLHPV